MVFWFTTASFAATLTIGPNGVYADVASALAAASDHDTLLLEDGLQINERVMIERPLDIVGNSPTTQWSCVQSPCISTRSPLTLRGFTLFPSAGAAGVDSRSALLVDHMQLLTESPAGGDLEPSIFHYGTELTILNSSIRATGSLGMGIFSRGDGLTIRDSVFHGTSYETLVGWIYGDITISNVSFLQTSEVFDGFGDAVVLNDVVGTKQAARECHWLRFRATASMVNTSSSRNPRTEIPCFRLQATPYRSAT